MKKLGIWLLAVVCFVAFSVTVNEALAKGKKKHGGHEDKASGPADMFKKLDKDNDGKVSEKEFTAGKKGGEAKDAKQTFDVWDDNKDGNLSEKEYTSGLKASEPNKGGGGKKKK